MNGKWKNVAVCEPCWRLHRPNQEPVRVKLPDDADPERCGSCQTLTFSGIYVRAFVNDQGEIVAGWPDTPKGEN